MKINKYDLSLKVLEFFSKQEPNRYVFRQNIISEPSSGIGALEGHFNITLNAEEKSLLDIVLRDLQEKNLVIPVFRDVMSSGNDLVITDKGKRALQTKDLDALDEKLSQLNNGFYLIEKRYGVYDAVLYQQTDWQSQAANSLIELIDQTLHAIGPDNEIKQEEWFIARQDKKITREDRIRFAVEKQKNRRSKSIEEITKKSYDLIDACKNRAEGIKHSREQTSDDLENLIQLTEDAMKYLLGV